MKEEERKKEGRKEKEEEKQTERKNERKEKDKKAIFYVFVCFQRTLLTRVFFSFLCPKASLCKHVRVSVIPSLHLLQSTPNDRRSVKGARHKFVRRKEEEERERERDFRISWWNTISNSSACSLFFSFLFFF